MLVYSVKTVRSEIDHEDHEEPKSGNTRLVFNKISIIKIKLTIYFVPRHYTILLILLLYSCPLRPLRRSTQDNRCRPSRINIRNIPQTTPRSIPCVCFRRLVFFFIFFIYIFVLTHTHIYLYSVFTYNILLQYHARRRSRILVFFFFFSLLLL